MNKYQNPMETAIGQVKNLLNNAVSKAMEKGTLPQAEIPDYVIEIPGDRKNGDFATNAAMASARAFRMAPAKIASAIVAVPVSVCGTGTSIIHTAFLATEHRRLPYSYSVPFARVYQRPGSTISMCPCA